MTFTLPFPPLLNDYWKNWRGRIVVSREGKRYRLGALVRAKSQGAHVLTGEVCVSLTFYRKARRGDMDGGLKCLLDSLQGVAYANDSQIRELHALQLEDKANPRVQIAVTEFSKNGNTA